MKESRRGGGEEREQTKKKLEIRRNEKKGNI